MKTFFDSSAYVKRFIEEEGSVLVEEICMQTTSLGLSIICVPEIMSGLNRSVREKNISPKYYDIIKNRLFEELQDVVILNITQKVVFKSIELLENNVLKAMDSLHLACAMEWNSDLFVSSDKRQIDAARKAGVTTRFI